MAKIGSKNTKPELLLRSWLHRNGFRFRLHKKDLPGRPDIVLPKYRACIFVHGCFWHFHVGCKRATIPKTHSEFWREKLNKNVERDRHVQDTLESLGWKVIVVWQCETKDLNPLGQRLIMQLKQGEF